MITTTTTTSPTPLRDAYLAALKEQRASTDAYNAAPFGSQAEIDALHKAEECEDVVTRTRTALLESNEPHLDVLEAWKCGEDI